MPRPFSEYPKWKYHRLELPRMVANEEAEASLGPDWNDEYQYQEWPRYVALPDGGHAIVAGPDELEELESGLAEAEISHEKPKPAAKHPARKGGRK